MDLQQLNAWLQSDEASDWDGILSEILATFDCTTGTLHVWDAGLGRLRLQAQRGIPPQLLPKMSEIPIGKGMAGIAAERREPVQTCNLQTDASGVARPSAKETPVEGAMTIPLMADGGLYGTLGIAKPTAYEFSDSETEEVMRVGRSLCERLRASESRPISGS